MHVPVSAFKAWILPALCISCHCSWTAAHWMCCFALQSCAILLPQQRTHGLNSLHLTWHIYLRYPVSPSIIADPIFNKWKYILSSWRLFKAHIWSSKPTFLASFLRLAAKLSPKIWAEETCAQKCFCMLLYSWSCCAWILCDREHEREIMPEKWK